MTTALIAAPATLLVGAFVFWANPARRVNQTVLLGSIQTASWLACWHMAVSSPYASPIALYWVRWTNATGALTPLALWIVKESIVGSLDDSVWHWLRRRWLWVLVPLLVALLPFTEAFIPSHSTGTRQILGPAYFPYMAAQFGFYAALAAMVVRSSLRLTGVHRLELQVWLGGGCGMCLAMWTLSLLSTWTHDPTYRRLMPFAHLLFTGGAAIAISVSRIFDARQLMLVALEKLVLTLLGVGMAFGLHHLLVPVLPAPFPLLLAVAVTLWLAIPLNSWLNAMFEFYPQATTARQAAFAVAAREARLERLESAYVGLLRGWGHAETAVILTGGKDGYRSGRIELASDSPVLESLRELRWATPERLGRERATRSRAALRAFLQENGLGVAVWTEGAALSAVVGVGHAASRRPYTYPQVTQLIELASIFQAALERAHFSVKAQHAEQLATVGLLGASLAHEIRNPLVTIKTFVQLLPRHYQDPNFREKFFTLIGDEVTRIDRLTEQLLDLASPRVYNARQVPLHTLLQSSIDLIAAKAGEKHVTFVTELKASPDVVHTDGAAVRQVLLNLCFNAIQAVESRPEPRWVKLSTRNVPEGVEMIVEDNGPGIAPGIRPRLFQPFQSTKSSGFGLGLAVCSDILADLNSTISVDPEEPGRGATFRVLFPCQAS